MVLRSGQSQEHQRKPWKSGSCLGASEAMSHSRGVLLARSFHQMLIQVCMCTSCKSSTRCGTVGKSDNNRWTACGLCIHRASLITLAMAEFSRGSLRDAIGPLLTMVLLPPLPIAGSAYPARYSYAQPPLVCRFSFHTAPQMLSGEAMCNSPVWQRLDRPFGSQKR
jgi:hypothetical protein